MKDRGELTPAQASSAGEDLNPDFWESAVVVEPRDRKSVHLKLEPEVFEYFKR